MYKCARTVDFGIPNSYYLKHLPTGTIGREVNEVLDKDMATLYMVDAYNYAHPADKLRPVSVSNGIAWTSDSKFMFYIDSPTRNIDVFDFVLEEGIIRK